MRTMERERFLIKEGLQKGLLLNPYVLAFGIPKLNRHTKDKVMQHMLFIDDKVQMMRVDKGKFQKSYVLAFGIYELTGHKKDEVV